MTSGEDRKSGGRTTGRGRSKSATSKPRSAQAQARAAKKAVTIDLEAKDLTPKPQAKSTTSKPSRAASEKVTATKASVKPTNAANKAKSGASKIEATSATAPRAKSTSSVPGSGATTRKDAADNFATENANAKTTVPPQTSPQKAGKSGGSFFPNLVASIIGGVIAVGGLIGLQKAEIIPSFGDGGVAALTSRVTNLEEAPAVDAVSLNEFASLSERLDEMEQDIENNDKSTIPDEVLARLTALEARLAGAEEGVAPVVNGDGSLPSGFTERLAAIEARLSANESDDVDGQIAALDEKLVKLDEGFAAVQSALTVEDSNNQPTVDVSAGSNDVSGASNDASSADLRSQLLALQKKVATLEIPLGNQGGGEAFVSAARQSIFSTIDPKFNALQAQLDETSSLLTAVQEKLGTVDGAQSDVGGKLAALSEKLGIVEGALDTQNETTMSVQLATKSLALENLKKVSQTGGAFGAALTSLERAGIEPEAISALQPFSVSGLKDTTSLKNELNNLISLAAAKDSPTGEAPKELTAFEKLVRNAKGFVKIRSLSDEGSGPFSRLPAQFDDGDLDGFVETLETLSDDQKQVFNQWLVEWKGNLALSSLIQQIEQDVAVDPADETSSQ